MKTLFAFYSFEGNCRELSRLMAEAVGGDVLEILPLEETVPHGGFMKFVKGGKSSLLKEAPALKSWDADVRSHDLVVVAGPVWAWNMAPPVRSFLRAVDWSGVRTALFAMSGGPPGATLTAMRRLVEEGGGRVIDTACFTDLRNGKGDATRARATGWARAVCDAAGRERDAASNG